MFGTIFLKVSAMALVVVCVSCGKRSDNFSSEKLSGTNQQIFQVKGVVEEIKPDGKSAVIKHEEIPNYMAAMTMEFETRNTNELRGLKMGDAISFRMIVTGDDGWIDQVKRLSTPPTEAPSRSTFRRVRDVEMLNVGDALPEYHFTNQFEQAVSLSQFKGQAVAIDFIFTTCPFPTMCPRLSQNFSDVQTKLKQMPNAPANWHLLTVSFDPEKDTSAVLKEYSGRFHADPQRWSFLTGDLIEITALAEQFGQTFWREGGSLSHNVRTVVIDIEGRVQKIIPENKWTSDDLIAEILKAAAPKKVP
ncbi:MAG: SCO family protein [Verrucomicrobiota bacterium]